ncbi:hypothetical protein FKG96_01165 [Olivibacter sp. LS-1]|uniref:TrlF family AAA-like ATPase n=1 Tax=Olivibacter sp. LS-1 TaxID=2592345 RepID=UPI0011EADDB4|nr:hypothetical protein [Olivibacter sp. LS-1]QEK99461.1 hypothetical protein FKG96_01165 [Olivibacter sp. LS-1]
MSEHLNKYHKGSEWRKWDLHFHTPASYDFADKSITNKEIIENLISNDVSVVAITDHHIIDVQRIEELQKLGGGKITVLPGIEFLCDSRGSEPIHFIAIFSESSNIQFIWEQIKNQTNIKRIYGDGKNVNEVYCNLEHTTRLIRDLGGLITIHAGTKTNTIDNITNALPHGIAQKEDIAKNIDIFELGKEEDILPYKTLVNPHLHRTINKVLPLIICSDNHNTKKYMVKQNLWIKADPNFEGLKQIIYEPEDRVQIQANKPEEKAGYQIIDHIEITSDSIFNTKLYLNQNLNSIIGGRSSGKSILLGAIATKVKTTRPIEFSDKEYQEYVKSISDTIKVIWKDGQEENNREVEYFEQGYMHKIARDKSQLNKIVNDILVQKGKEPILEDYKRFLTDNSKAISGLVSDYYRLLQDIHEKEQKARDKGDKKGIEDELFKLKDELQKLTVIAITDEEKHTYEQTKTALNNNIQRIQLLSKDIELIKTLKSVSIVKESIDYELASLSQEIKENISSALNSIKDYAESKWKEDLQKLSASAEEDKSKLIQNNEDLEKDAIYLKVLEAYKGNAQLSEYEAKIKTQTDKLFEITALLSEIGNLKEQIKQSKEKITIAHRIFYDKINDVLPKLSDQNDGLTINAKFKFEVDNYRKILNAGLNLQGFSNRDLAEYQYDNFENFEKHQFDIFDKLEKNKLTLKGGYNNQSLTTTLVSTNFFSLNYDIEYEGDDFKKMSDGKKAFVLLKLLLDFNDKNCPILIDQPEDDLDNRAIYNDLVQYLRKKKKLRQIIVATHNPNIVVGADSELVICANQHGEKNINNGTKKFQYVTGGLEHTFPNNGNPEVLESQGTKEHVCEVLEGGNTAFKLREKKYSIKE